MERRKRRQVIWRASMLLYELDGFFGDFENNSKIIIDVKSHAEQG
jgi:hypothetical protein